MKVVGITTLKAKLSEYLAAVEAGHEVLVTDRDRPVARIVRAGSAGSDVAEESGRLDRLARAGVVSSGSGSIPDSFWDLGRPADRADSVRAALDEERRHER